MLRRLHEPTAVETINLQGTSPFIITCEHAGNLIPECLQSLGLTEAQLATDVAWDVGAGDVTRVLCKLLDARGVLSRYSRLVIDCNRAPSDPASIPVISQRGFAVPGNADLTHKQKQQRAKEFFWPYQNVIQESVDNYIVRHQRPPIMVSIHSFAPEYDGLQRPWHVGVLWNEDNRMAGPVMAALAADKTILVGDNEPYTARDEVGHGYAIHTHAESKQYPHVMLEIRGNEIDTLEKASFWADKIAHALLEAGKGIV